MSRCIHNIHTLHLTHNLPSHPHNTVLVRMRATLKQLQTVHAIITQAVLGQHATDGLAQHLGATKFVHEAFHADGAQTAGPGVVSMVQFLGHLVARDAQLGAVGHDDVVATVGRRIPDRLVLALQDERDA